jgi:hypothetical protein
LLVVVAVPMSVVVEAVAVCLLALSHLMLEQFILLLLEQVVPVVHLQEMLERVVQAAYSDQYLQ